MRENKSRFELASKVLGLMLVLAGIWMALDAVLLALHIPDYKAIYQGLRIPSESQKEIRPFDDFERGIWRDLFFILTFKSMLPLLLGMYLMKPGNLFSAYTYPSVEEAGGALSADNPQHVDPAADPEAVYQPFAMGAAADKDAVAH